MKSKIIIVDEKDNIIGYKDRDSIKREDIYRVSALWITNSNGDILLAQRALTKTHGPGKWGPAVAGTNDKGETYEMNIIKEAEEEIGLKNIKPKLVIKVRRSEEYNYFVQWFLLKIDKPISEFSRDPVEVERIKWFSKEELLKDIHTNPKMFVESAKSWTELFFK